MRAVCPICSALVGISMPKQIAAGWSACSWKLDLHSDGKGGLCAGGGRRI